MSDETVPRDSLFVVALAAALSMSVLSYRKAFTPAVFVTLHTDHTGLQLNSGRRRQAARGHRRPGPRRSPPTARSPLFAWRSTRGDAAQIPDNVTAQMLPETLFGERYVALQIPAQASAAPLRNGSVIGQDRSSSAVELERVLDEALPLLRAIQPDKLAATLGALATALDGRGERIGQDLVTFDQLPDGAGRSAARHPRRHHQAGPGAGDLRRRLAGPDGGAAKRDDHCDHGERPARPTCRIPR